VRIWANDRPGREGADGFGQGLYHYTDVEALRQMALGGAIMPSLDICPAGDPISSLVWLSSNPVVELGCRAAADLGLSSFDDLERAAWSEGAGSLVRIEVDPSCCCRWLDHPAIRTMPDWQVLHLQQLGVEAGACPAHWFVSDLPIPLERWLGVEVWKPQGWMTAETACRYADRTGVRDRKSAGQDRWQGGSRERRGTAEH